MIIEATCKGPYCLEDIRYSWTLYQFALSTKSSWLEVQNIQRYLLTNVDGTNIVFSGSREPLKQRTKYKVIASVLLHDQIVERGDMVFFTNSPPHNPYGGLGCGVFPKKGFVLQTRFNVTCFGWEDEDLPLSYQMSYRSPEGLVIISKGNTSSFITMLPQGNQSENYEVKLEVQVFDSLGDASAVEFSVEVEPLSKAEVTTAVNKAILGPNSTAAKLLRSGNLESAALTSYFSLTATQGTGLSAMEINSAKDEVLRQLAKARPQMLPEVTQLSAVVIKATQQRNYMTSPAIVRLCKEYYKNTINAATLLKSMTNHLDTEASKSDDIDVIQQVGGDLLNGMSYVLDVLTKTETADIKRIEKLEKNSTWPEKLHTSSNKEEPRESEKLVALIGQLGTTLISTKVVGELEPSVFKTKGLSLVLDRQTPSILARKHLQWNGGSSGVFFPSKEVLTQNSTFPLHFLDAQVIAFKSNPFAWDMSSRYVTSDVMDVSIKTNGSYLHLSKLKEPFELYIPMKQQKKQETDGHFFVKRSKSFENIRYHKILIPSERAVAIIDIVPIESNLLTIFISAGFRPTADNYSYSTYVPNYSSCRKVTTGNGYQQCSSISPYRLLVSSSMTGASGIHYIGIVLHNNTSDGLRMNDTSTKGDVHRRHLRSACNTKRGRKKRSCIGVKDPPTTPSRTLKIIKPAYNSNADANYTMSASISSCLYWSKEKRQWTNDGCKVGSNTNPSKLHCLCTHLSSFGGDFFVAANPIDFDKVWFELGTLGETGNFVTVVVFCIYGVYLVGLYLARRADKRDQDKVVANVVIRKCDQGGCTYEIHIQTGMWKGFGTTANVGIDICGEDGSSGQIFLTDLSLYKKVFSRGSVTNFVIILPRSLGRLVKLCIWHDNFGQSPSWFLQQVVITEFSTGTKWYFFANKWIALERGSGNLFLELRALDENERAGFKHLFCSKTSRSLGDEHLWVSLFTRPPHSPFTRCQRLSCCLSFLFTSMVVNAMFYQFSDKPTRTFKFGLLLLSWRQIIIGIQSGFIAIPVNMLIVTAFRNVKPHVETAYDPNLTFTVKETSCKLPRYFVFIAWNVCMLVTLAFSALTVFYSLSWGAEISNQWLTSIIVSLVEDVVFIQPVKVIFFAIFSSLVIRTSPGKEDVDGTTFYIDKALKYNAPNEHLLIKAKKYGTQLLEMSRTIKNVVAFFVFALLLMVVCYGNRDSQRFLMTASVKDGFPRFEKVADKDSFWVWTSHELIPGLYHVSWNKKEPFYYKEGFHSNRQAFLMGMPRLRQIRLKQEKMCKGDKDILPVKQVIKRCLLPYSKNNEDKSQYYQPKWISVQNWTKFSSNLKLYEVCPKPWRYQTPQMLQTLPYQGLSSKYDGGGYVAELGYNEESAMDVISRLKNNDWIDEFTAAVFIEFSVHEPSSRLFSLVKYLYERLPTGGVVTTVNVQTLALYPPFGGSFTTFYKLCQLVFVVYILIILVLETKEIMYQKKAYFTQFWNWVNIVQISTSTSAVIIGLLKAKQASLYARKVQNNPYDSFSPDRIARLSDYENYLLAVVIFFATIRLLKLIKFNPHICQMAATLRRSGRTLISFAVVFLNSLLAFSLAGILTFGADIASFSSFYQSFGTVVQMSLGGNVNFLEMKLFHMILGPLFLSTFVIWIVLVLVNIFVAILVDVYAVERENAMFSNDSLASFMYIYFSTKASKFLRSLLSNVKSKVVRQRGQYSRKHWKRAAKRVIEVSHTLANSLGQIQLARNQDRISDQEAESIFSFQEFESFQNGEHWKDVDKSDSFIQCTCNGNEVIYPEISISASIGCSLKNADRHFDLLKTNSVETIPLTSDVTLYSDDDGHLALNLAYLEFLLNLDDFDIKQVKSNIFDVIVELNNMLAEFKKTDYVVKTFNK
ncbi:hypothetical protein ACROYT_G004234 [Oculina patagonica]